MDPEFAWGGKGGEEMSRTFGVIEGSSYAAVIAAAERATKAADVRVVKNEKVGEHAAAIVLEGDTGDIQIAMDELKNGNGQKDGQFTPTALASTKGKLLSAFGLRRWF